MPELPEVERVRRTLLPAMLGASFDRVVLNRPDLRRPFPAGFARRLRGQGVQTLTRRGKYLLAVLSSGDVLVIHLGMSGWLRVERTATLHRRPRDPAADLERRHDHVVFEMSTGMTVTFNDPRRFGVMDLVGAGRLPLGTLGPEPLSRAFDGADAGGPRREPPRRAESGAPRSADRGGHRQHLRERSAPSRPAVALPRGGHGGHSGRRASARRRAPDRRDQSGTAARDRAGRLATVTEARDFACTTARERRARRPAAEG